MNPARSNQGNLRGFFMPIYEYQCAACSKVTEMLQKFSDPAPSKCEACGGGPLQKLISQSSFVLNGTGWYVTDFRGGKPPVPKNDDAPKTETPGTGKTADGTAPQAPASAAPAASAGQSGPSGGSGSDK